MNIRTMNGIQPMIVMMYLLLLIAIFTTVDATGSIHQLRGLMDNKEEGDKATEDTDDAMSNEDVETMINNGTNATTTQQQQGLVDLVHLIPFDVQIAVTINMGIQLYEVSNIVTDWFTDAYKEQLAIFGYTNNNQYAEFNSVVLSNNDEQRQRYTQVTNDNLFVASFRGGVVFTRDAVNRTLKIPANDVLVIQQNVLLNDTGLLMLLQQSTDATGLGSFVIDTNAFLNPSTSNTDNDSASDTSSNNSGLDVVIIIAIVIAVIAFLFLLGAIVWAYRFDRANRDAYLASNLKDQNTMMGHPSNNSNKDTNMNDKTTSETETMNDPDTPERIHRSMIVIEGSPNSVNNTSVPDVYPTMIGGGAGNGRDQPLHISDINHADDGDDENYPASVISDSVVSGSAISEDVSTSLSQYYRSGMGKADLYGRSGMLSDAGSVSSMESYGYSLDGGMSMAIPTEIPFQPQRDRQRIGGLPIEPDAIATTGSHDGSIFDERSMDDVQILDLDKELSNLDIKLLPKYLDDIDNDENADLEKYQLEDAKEMTRLNENGIPTVVSMASSTASKTSSKKTASSKASSKASSSKKSTTVPIDTDSMIGTPDSDEDEFNEDLLPKLSTDKIV